MVEHKYAYKAICCDQETNDVVEVHTNRIEGAWKHAKKHFRDMNGTSMNNFEGHLFQIMF